MRLLVARLGRMKGQRAEPLLVSFIKRRVNTDVAAIALGEIGDSAAGPVLVELLKSKEFFEIEYLVVTAIGDVKYLQAIPTLTPYLQRGEGMNENLSDAIFQAFLKIGDKSVIPDIEKYLKRNKQDTAAQSTLIQLKYRDPIPRLLTLLSAHEKVMNHSSSRDEWDHSDIIQEIAHYKDVRAVNKLGEIAENSDSGFLRRQSIFALRDIGKQQALLELAKLLNYEFPSSLTANSGWKMKPGDWPAYFHETLIDCLKQTTNQDFGTDSEKWRKWIEANVKA